MEGSVDLVDLLTIRTIVHLGAEEIGSLGKLLVEGGEGGGGKVGGEEEGGRVGGAGGKEEEKGGRMGGERSEEEGETSASHTHILNLITVHIN